MRSGLWIACSVVWMLAGVAWAKPSVLVVVDVRVKPGNVEAVLQGFKRSQESCSSWEGCERFEVTVSAENPNQVVVIERWESVAAHKALLAGMMGSDSFRDFRKLLERDLEFRYLELK